jgi:hypothetical protein
VKQNLTVSLLALGLLLILAPLASANTMYTQDPNIADFTSPIVQYATFTNFSGGDVGSPYTATSSDLATKGFRVFAGGAVTGLPGGNNWILATFASPESNLVVFANIDHPGFQYDGYQYTIQGSNDGTTWTPLFDALSVVGAGEPFTLGTFTGTAPDSVNNVVNGACGPGGCVGYEATFNFGAAYQFYAFGASSVAFAQGNSDQELSGVGTVPEPSSLLLLASGLPWLLTLKRLKRA